MSSVDQKQEVTMQQTIREQEARIERLEMTLARLLPEIKPSKKQTEPFSRGSISRSGLIKGVAAGAAGLAAVELAGVLKPSIAEADDGISNAALFRGTGVDGSGENASGVAFSTYPEADSQGQFTSYQQGVWAFGAYSGVQGVTGDGSYEFRDNDTIAGAPNSGISPCGVYGTYRVNTQSPGAVPGGNGVQGNTDANGFSGVYGSDNSPTGGYGVQASSANGIGVYATATAADAIQGHSSKAGKSGVAGFNSDASGFGTFGQGYYGVWGRTITGRCGVVGTTAGSGGPVSGDTTMYGVFGDGTNNGVGVQGASTVSEGVRGTTSGNKRSGVMGTDTSPNGGFGLYGRSTEGVGAFAMTHGDGKAALSGLDNSANGGYGAYGYSINGVGVYGTSSSTLASASAMLAELTSQTPGAGSSAIFGKNDGTNGNGYGVHGSHAGSGDGGYFQSKSGAGVLGYSSSGTAISGSSTSGRGGKFAGKLAQLHLVPATTSGKPTSSAHLAGDLFLDKNCNLYLCTASGTPGAWKQVTLT